MPAACLASDEDVSDSHRYCHKDGRSGWVGIGVARVPRACFEQAIRLLDTKAEGTKTAVEHA